MPFDPDAEPVPPPPSQTPLTISFSFSTEPGKADSAADSAAAAAYDGEGGEIDGGATSVSAAGAEPDELLPVRSSFTKYTLYETKQVSLFDFNINGTRFSRNSSFFRSFLVEVVSGRVDGE